MGGWAGGPSLRAEGQERVPWSYLYFDYILAQRGSANIAFTPSSIAELPDSDSTPPEPHTDSVCLFREFARHENATRTAARLFPGVAMSPTLHRGNDHHGRASRSTQPQQNPNPK